jgi:ElaB/YqjD/DUF883 family membrane-anchored ribosome-binding protein
VSCSQGLFASEQTRYPVATNIQIRGVKQPVEHDSSITLIFYPLHRSGEIMTTEINAIPGTTTSSAEALTRDFKGVLGKAEHLLKDAGHVVAEDLSATRHAMSDAACKAASATHHYVRGNPWKIVGMAAAAGIFIGALIRRH